MELWTEVEFQRVALRTRIAERTLAACTDVLGEGLSGMDAAAKHQMFQAQISRAIGTLREKQEQSAQRAVTLRDDAALREAMATGVAKHLLGDAAPVKSAQFGQIYEGPGIAVASDYLVQRVGSSGVLHDIGNLPEVPPLKVSLRLEYPAEKGLVNITKITTPEKSNDLGR